MLAPEVVLISDGGGVRQAEPRPVTGADKAARFIIGGLGKARVARTGEPTVVNGNSALVLRVDGEIDGVLANQVGDARISGLYHVRNPVKLTRIAAETALTLRGRAPVRRPKVWSCQVLWKSMICRSALPSARWSMATLMSSRGIVADTSASTGRRPWRHRSANTGMSRLGTAEPR